MTANVHERLTNDGANSNWRTCGMMRQSNCNELVSLMMAEVGHELGALEAALAQLRLKLATTVSLLDQGTLSSDAPVCADPELGTTNAVSGTACAEQPSDALRNSAEGEPVDIDHGRVIEGIGTTTVGLALDRPAVRDEPASEQHDAGGEPVSPHHLSDAGVDASVEFAGREDKVNDVISDAGAIEMSPLSGDAAPTTSNVIGSIECISHAEPEPASIGRALAAQSSAHDEVSVSTDDQGVCPSSDLSSDLDARIGVTGGVLEDGARLAESQPNENCAQLASDHDDTTDRGAGTELAPQASKPGTVTATATSDVESAATSDTGETPAVAVSARAQRPQLGSCLLAASIALIAFAAAATLSPGEWWPQL